MVTTSLFDIIQEALWTDALLCRHLFFQCLCYLFVHSVPNMFVSIMPPDNFANGCGEKANLSWISMPIGPNVVAAVVENWDRAPLYLETFKPQQILNQRWQRYIDPWAVYSTLCDIYYRPDLRKSPQKKITLYAEDLFHVSSKCAIFHVYDIKFWTFISIQN